MPRLKQTINAKAWEAYDLDNVSEVASFAKYNDKRIKLRVPMGVKGRIEESLLPLFTLELSSMVGREMEVLLTDYSVATATEEIIETPHAAQPKDPIPSPEKITDSHLLSLATRLKEQEKILQRSGGNNQRAFAKISELTDEYILRQQQLAQEAKRRPKRDSS